jgi:hypothetical protein
VGWAGGRHAGWQRADLHAQPLLRPRHGQFTQPDPIGLAGGLNSYGFAAGDPVSYADPYGLCKIEVQYTPAGYVGKHSVIITTEEDGTATAWDAGPAHGPPSGGNASGASGGSGGSSSESSGSNSPSANGSSPRAGEGNGDDSSMYGELVAKSTSYVRGQRIYQPNAPRTLVLHNDKSCEQYARSFRTTIGIINRANIVYNPFTTNSNAAAHLMLDRAGLQVLARLLFVFVPGWDRNLLAGSDGGGGW